MGGAAALVSLREKVASDHKELLSFSEGVCMVYREACMSWVYVEYLILMGPPEGSIGLCCGEFRQ